MKFLVDAQLPRRLVLRLREAGFDAIHTLDLEEGNRTSDAKINAISIAQERAVVTKDADFVDSFVLHQRPWKLLLISTGNIGNRELEELFSASLRTISQGFSGCDFIELGRTKIILHS
jgi:predicted nuclease of predicted toxin-antitoxin system